MEVHYYLGADLLATRFRPDAPLSGDLVTIDGEKYLVERRAVRLNDLTDQFEAFEVQVRPIG